MSKRSRFAVPSLDDIRKDKEIGHNDVRLFHRSDPPSVSSTDSKSEDDGVRSDSSSSLHKDIQMQKVSSEKDKTGTANVHAGLKVFNRPKVPLPSAEGSLRSQAIVVNPVQRENPIVKYIKNVPWEVGSVEADFVLGRTTCALFLSCRYHVLKPEYIHERLKALGKGFELRLLLVLVDMKQCQQILSYLAKMAILSDLTLVLAWSSEEAALYLETYKAFEHKPADSLKERMDGDLSSRAVDSLCSLRKVNRTDAATLLHHCKSLEAVVNCSQDELAMCPGVGMQKARTIWAVSNEPFQTS